MLSTRPGREASKLWASAFALAGAVLSCAGTEGSGGGGASSVGGTGGAGASGGTSGSGGATGGAGGTGATGALGGLGGVAGDESGGGGSGGTTACNDGQQQPCYTGPVGTDGVGICKAGVQDCAGGKWSSCVGQIVAAPAEVCNGLDDDCNGLADEGFGQTTCGKGACLVTTDNCSNGVPVACTPKPASPTEKCDGVDDNCDGTIDEGCVCTAGQTQSCYSGPAGTKNVGACKAGTQGCNGGQWGPCNGQVLPKTETCNAADDDCNGTADDGNPGGGASCNTGKLGICAAGTSTCTGGALGCKQNSQPGPTEICSNSLDDDCDGQTNEGCSTVAQIIHYELEQSSGTSVPNLAPGQPPGSIVGTLTWTSGGGAPGSAFHLVNPSGGVNHVAPGITTTLTGATIEFFWKFSSGTGTSYMWYDGPTTFRAFTNGVANTGVMVRNTPGGTDVKYATSVQNGQWHHIAYVLDAAASQGRLYVDGTLAGSSAYSGSVAMGTTFVVLGRPTTANSATTGFDRYRIWSNALTPAQIASIIAGTL